MRSRAIHHHEKYNQIVLLRNIPFHSICEHHFLPFVGHAHVAYLSRDKVVGLSKLARVVEGFALRPQVQERLTDQVADAIMNGLRPLGAICIMDASHTCMTIRGIQKPGASMATSAIRGVLVRNQATRTEVLNLIYGSVGLQMVLPCTLEARHHTALRIGAIPGSVDERCRHHYTQCQHDYPNTHQYV